MTSKILQEMKDNFDSMWNIIDEQVFTIKDAKRLLERYGNVIRKMEQLTESRDMWKAKHDKLKEASSLGKVSSRENKKVKQ